jgi:isopropylmalate/homocitrate/citramalate synthase
MGERAGNAELEKVLLFLVQRVEGFQKYDLSCLREFAEFMEQEVGLRVPRNKAAVGRNIFAHESGIHTSGVIKNPYLYEPYPPELVGGRRSMMIGPTSGTDVVRLKVEETLKDLIQIETKVDKTDWRIRAIHSEIKRLYDEEKRNSCISDDELRAFVEKYFLFSPILEAASHHRDEKIQEDKL